MKRLFALMAFALATTVLAQTPTTPVLGPAKVTLLSNASASGTQQYWPGGIGMFMAVGTFGGATVTLEILGDDGVTWVPAGTGTTLTAAGAGVAYIAPGYIKVVVSGGSPSGLYASFNRVTQGG